MDIINEIGIEYKVHLHTEPNDNHISLLNYEQKMYSCSTVKHVLDCGIVDKV